MFTGSETWLGEVSTPFQTSQDTYRTQSLCAEHSDFSRSPGNYHWIKACCVHVYYSWSLDLRFCTLVKRQLGRIRTLRPSSQINLDFSHDSHCSWARFKSTMVRKFEILSDWPKHLLTYLLGGPQIDGP